MSTMYTVLLGNRRGQGSLGWNRKQDSGLRSQDICTLMEGETGLRSSGCLLLKFTLKKTVSPSPSHGQKRRTWRPRETEWPARPVPPTFMAQMIEPGVRAGH